MTSTPKICIVTGGFSGIGEATALLALEQSYRVYNLD
jgi:NAD(P)-dependent dehydrogenase (short-subunit alcohol dehydrogenase family)